ncbi:TPA: transcriptional regulator PtsJ [Klebsiella aerogenes]|uniref:MocR-like B6 salvage transcription factor PtsJ n=1 Tax=Klebsiella aerogenes TaxID=548 RepID=UPI0005EE3AB9|nr:transcriptional regulator PtsJ [Klebsiella aerogenes]ATY01553.1 transcriptional regulator PtsJ [Klebsiella aerogenes]EIV6645700.1 transcriptional regulator PtsJ [Klebsiella aerogenes]EIV6850614.1 transcriptional regulator PtsJ [Klebsiella aerogenes]EKQ6526269.1 transcriptional regulator PtsJ [Klebsiella aerogenes]EKT3982324.1 transcriptional regulator PtsJ [Klebsiella aerogenes]
MFTGKTASEIFDNIRHLVQSGALQPGEALPPVRELAGELAVNRNTVAAAYKRLVTSGLAVSQGRNGTAIKARNTLNAVEGGDPTTSLIDISGGNPDPRCLPDIGRFLPQLAQTPHLYGDAAVEPRLADWAREWVSRDIGQEFDINLTSGAIDALERLLCALLLPGDSVAVEDPCFLSSINMLRYAGFQPSPVAVDGEGMDPERLEEALRNGARAVILTPRAHNPTGCSLTPERAQAIRAVLARYPQTLAIVDDHFALLSATCWHNPLPDGIQRWALVRSMSKTLGPDLRLAIVASDPTTSAALRLRLNAGSQWVSHLLQELAFACLNDSAFAASLTASQRHYQQQNQRLAAALARHGAGDYPPGDGLNFWLPLSAASQPLALRLARAGWLVREGEAFGVKTPAHGLRLSLGALTEAQIEQLAHDLSLVLPC